MSENQKTQADSKPTRIVMWAEPEPPSDYRYKHWPLEIHESQRVALSSKVKVAEPKRSE